MSVAAHARAVRGRAPTRAFRLNRDSAIFRFAGPLECAQRAQSPASLSARLGLAAEVPGDPHRPAAPRLFFRGGDGGETIVPESLLPLEGVPLRAAVSILVPDEWDARRRAMLELDDFWHRFGHQIETEDFSWQPSRPTDPEDYPVDWALYLTEKSVRSIYVEALDYWSNADRNLLQTLEKVLFGGQYRVEARPQDILNPYITVDLDQWRICHEKDFIRSSASDLNSYRSAGQPITLHSIRIVPAQQSKTLLPGPERVTDSPRTSNAGRNPTHRYEPAFDRVVVRIMEEGAPNNATELKLWMTEAFEAERAEVPDESTIRKWFVSHFPRVWAAARG